MRNRFQKITWVIGLISFLITVPTGTWAQRPVSARAQRRLQREVRHKLIMLPFYGVFDILEFKVEGYNVTLTGQVTRTTLRTGAEGVVKNIEGVEEIINQIEVLPLSSNDDRIRLAVYNAVYSQAALQRYALQASIHIIVKGGNVTFVGVVANEGDKNIAYIRAKGVSGLFSVTNNLRVERSERK